MATYYMNEGAFELPDAGFVDRTVHVFEAPLPRGEELGVIICRARFPEGKSLRDLVSIHLAGEAKKLRGYSIIEQRDAEWAGAPAIDIRSRWRLETRVVYQRQAHLAVLDTWMLFGATAPLGEREACDRCLDHILSSLRLRGAA
ncbi:MAG TPA: DcrB-related protein [Polyangiaceae bacterium]|nr:DcrB-related protein [Polyangiaceae bacterium]